jgi:hypothetical protein
LKRKFTLEFDEAPALVFVQHRVGTIMNGNAALYVDGRKVEGVRELSITASVGDVTSHEIEFITGMTKEAAE